MRRSPSNAVKPALLAIMAPQMHPGIFFAVLYFHVASHQSTSCLAYNSCDWAVGAPRRDAPRSEAQITIGSYAREVLICLCVVDIGGCYLKVVRTLAWEAPRG